MTPQLLLIMFWLLVTAGGASITVFALGLYIQDMRLANPKSVVAKIITRQPIRTQVLRLVQQIPLAFIGVLALIHPQNPGGQTTIWGTLSVLSLIIPALAMMAASFMDLTDRWLIMDEVKKEH